MTFRDQHELQAFLAGANLAATKRGDRTPATPLDEDEREAAVLAVLREAGAV